MTTLLSGCSITVERRFYEGSDPLTDAPTLENSRATVGESTNWPFYFEALPEGNDKKKEPISVVLPTEDQNRKYPGASTDNLIAEYVLSGRSKYSYIDILERKLQIQNDEVISNIPEGWVPVNVATGKNASGQCGAGDSAAIVKDQDANIEDLGSAEESPETNDFRAHNIPVQGGCHYIVYYMKAPGQQFDFKLKKVDNQNRDTGLKGAQFELEGLDESNKGLKAPKLGDTNEAAGLNGTVGEFNWVGLKTGRYKLSETKAPEGGYVMLSKPAYFRVATEKDGDKDVAKLYILSDATDTTGTLVSDPSEIVQFPVVHFSEAKSGDTVQVTMKVANTKGGELPKTGGHGIYMQFLLGLLMLLAGAFTARQGQRCCRKAVRPVY